jgi:hypothetical protein
MKDNDRSGPKLTADVTAVMAAARKRRVPEIGLSNDLATMDLADGRDLRQSSVAVPHPGPSRPAHGTR